MTTRTKADAKFVAHPSFQIGAGPTGGVDCLAHATCVVIRQFKGRHATSAVRGLTGRGIRLLTDEPVPDRGSPGLNLPQVAAVAEDGFNVPLDVRIGARSLDWDEYEERRRDGWPAVIQVSYQPISESKFDAGRGFRDGHGMAETHHATYDPLADGRAPGVHRWSEQLYPRSLMKEAAGELVIGFAEGNKVRAGNGRVWCAVADDTTPPFRAAVLPRRGRVRRAFRAFRIEGGRIRGYRVLETPRGGFTSPCGNPRAFRWPDNDDALRFLVKLRGREFRGLWIHAHWSQPA